MKTAVIYKIINLQDGKVYIGSSVNMPNRWRCHRTALRRGVHHSRHLQYAWNKYGEAAFKVDVIASCAALCRTEMEQRYIDLYRAYDSSHGYNICPVAGSVQNKPHSAATKEKIRAANTGRVFTEKHRQRISDGQRNRVVSEETRQLLSKAGKGRIFSKDSIQKSAQARKGFKHSDAAKKIMQQKAIGRVVTEATRQKLSSVGKYRKWTEGQRAKMAAVQRDPLSLERRLNIARAKGSKPFVVTAKDGTAHAFQMLSEVTAIGLDRSNVHKCLIGKAKQTKGYCCAYSDAPHFVGQI